MADLKNPVPLGSVQLVTQEMQVLFHPLESDLSAALPNQARRAMSDSEQE
jgi:hypothetical protein